MRDLTARIESLEAAEAVRILRAITNRRLRNHEATELSPDNALATALETATGTAPTLPVSEGELARANLLLVADDPAMQPVLDVMIENPAAEAFPVEPMTLAIGTMSLIILQSYIKFERDKQGKWSFKFEKQPMSNALLGQVLTKLGGWLKGS